jgi:hypothetical protein
METAPAASPDDIRALAKTLLHWLEIAETGDLMKEVGILPRGKEKIDKDYDRRAQAFAKHALPAQVVRLHPDAPMVSLHLFAEIYDNGFLRADPWRWWFAWLALELIAESGLDPAGRRIRTFLKDSETHPLTDESAARWLACNPLRSRYWTRRIERDIVLAQTHRKAETANVAVQAEQHLALALRKPLEVLRDGMLDEAAEIAAALSLRLEERVLRNGKARPPKT